MKEVTGPIIAIATTALFFGVFGIVIGFSKADVRCDDCGRIYENQDTKRLSSNDDTLILCNGCYKKAIGNLVKDKIIFLENKAEKE